MSWIVVSVVFNWIPSPDFRITGADFTGYRRLNYTLVSQVLDVDQKHSYHSPRVVNSINGNRFFNYKFNCNSYLATVLPLSFCKQDHGRELDPYDVSWKYFGLGKDHCETNDETNKTVCTKCWDNTHSPSECFSEACGTQAFDGKLLLSLSLITTHFPPPLPLNTTSLTTSIFPQHLFIC